MVDLCTEVVSLRQRIGGWRRAGDRIALVPTMGALHAGHMALVEAARREADRVVVTIFVNPTQFAPNEDFAAYPRDLDADRARIEASGADLIFAPNVPAMYPPAFATSIHVGGPAEAGLEDRFRPTHFSGVATVVAKLLSQAQPDRAFFGEKDYQQLKVIQRFAIDLDVPVAIVGVPIVREPDGLALSSRNAYLADDARALAPRLHATLAACASEIEGGALAATAQARAAERLTAAGFVVDYVEARDAESLGPFTDGVQGRLLAAARLGTTRLIDNVALGAKVSGPALPAR